MARVTLDHWPHPLTADGREIREVDVSEALALIGRRADVHVIVDGHMAPGSDVALRGGEIVTVRPRLAGDDSNPIATILQIGLVIAGAYIGGLGGFGAQLLAAAVVIVGGLVINALFPPREPELPGDQERREVYSLRGGSNAARHYDPLRLVMGTHRIFPDLGAEPYTEYEEDDEGVVQQYLYQILHCGVGDLDLEEASYAGTPLSSYDEVVLVSSDADGRIALQGLFSDVSTADGADLADAEWVERTTEDGTDRIAIDLIGHLYRVTNRGGVVQNTVDIEAGYRLADGSLGEHFTPLAVPQFAHGSSEIYRRTFRYTLPAAGRYVVRVRRTTVPSENQRVRDNISWTALRSYRPDSTDYSGQTRLGLRVRASGQVRGAMDKIALVAHQRIPVWDGAAWTPGRSSNPAWLARWFALGLYHDGRLVAGMGLPAERIDEDVLVAWGAWCDLNRLQCNFDLHGPATRREVMEIICKAGRATISWHTGKFGVIWDAPRPVSGLITPGNVLAGSMRVDWAAGPRAEEVVCRYIDPDRDWQWTPVRRTMPGVASTPVRSVTQTLRGVTSRRQAIEECALQAARQAYFDREISWRMSLEGFALTRGSVLGVAHSLVGGGTAGRGVTVAGASAEIRWRGPGDAPRMTGGDWLEIRYPDGSFVARRLALANTADGVITVTVADPWPEMDGEPIDALWRHYAANGAPVNVRIAAIRPVSESEVEVAAIDDVPEYYAAASAAEDQPLPDIRSVDSRIPRVVRGIVSERRIAAGDVQVVELELLLVVAGDWRGGVVRAAVGDGAPAVVAVLVDGDTAAHWIGPQSGRITITVVPGTAAAPAGPVWTIEYTIGGLLLPPPPPTDLAVVALGLNRGYSWVPPDVQDLLGVLIRYATAEGRASRRRGCGDECACRQRADGFHRDIGRHGRCGCHSGAGDPGRDLAEDA